VGFYFVSSAEVQKAVSLCAIVQTFISYPRKIRTQEVILSYFKIKLPCVQINLS
jgi:hypothetical protein